MEVVIPNEIGMLTMRTISLGNESNSKDMIRHLNWVDETKEIPFIQLAAYQQRAKQQVFNPDTLFSKESLTIPSKLEQGNSKPTRKVHT